MLTQAVEQGVKEQLDLDWKREGYGPKETGTSWPKTSLRWRTAAEGSSCSACRPIWRRCTRRRPRSSTLQSGLHRRRRTAGPATSSGTGQARPRPGQRSVPARARLFAQAPIQRLRPGADRGGSAQPTARAAAHTSRGHRDGEDLKGETGFVSLHDDGSISLCWTAGGFHDHDPFDLYAFMVERTAADLAALVGATARGLGIDSAYTLKVGVTHPSDKPVSVWHQPDANLDSYGSSSRPAHQASAGVSGEPGRRGDARRDRAGPRSRLPFAGRCEPSDQVPAPSSMTGLWRLDADR